MKQGNLFLAVQSRVGRFELVRCNLTRVALATVLAVGLFLRVYKLEFHSLWSDELTSWYECWQPSFREFWKIYSELELTPPLFFLLEFLVARLAPAAEWSVRLISLLAGVGFVFASYLFAKELFARALKTDSERSVARWAGVAGAAFAATSYKAILFSQEGRSYALLMCLAALSGWAWLRIEPSSQTLKESRWKTYFFTSVALSYTHYFGVIMIISHAVSVGFLKPLGRRECKIWFKVYLSLALAYLPWVLLLLSHSARSQGGMGKTPFKEIFVAHRELFGSSSANSLLALVLALIAIVLARKTARAFRERIAVLSWVFLPFVISWAITQWIVPIYSWRYYMVALAPTLAIAAVGTIEIRKWSKIAAGFVAALFVVLGLHETVIGRGHYSVPRAEQTREAFSASIDILKRHPDAKFVLVGLVPFQPTVYLDLLGAPKALDLIIPVPTFASGDQWPGEMKAAGEIVVLRFFDYEPEVETVFASLPQDFRVDERYDFHHVSVARLLKVR